MDLPFLELLFVFSLTVGLPIVLLKMVMDYKRRKLELEATRSEGQLGLTVGELKQLLQELVEDANAPLAERVASLERQLPLPGGDSAPVYPQIDEDRSIGRPVPAKPIR